jgi:hypothetical protein
VQQVAASHPFVPRHSAFLLMLLFKKKFLDAIRCGEKTQTVRLWTRSRMSAGQRSYIPGIGYIRIEAVDPVPLTDLTDEDARLDGFPTADALRAEIDAIYSQYPDRGQQPFRIRFVLTPGETKKPRPAGARSKPKPGPVKPAIVAEDRTEPASAARTIPAIAPPTGNQPNRVALPAEGFPLIAQSL